LPARPSYFHRIREAIEVFRRLPSPWIDRRTLEQTLGVSKTVGWRIMRRCGASDGPGNTLICGREELIRTLETLEQTPECDRELRRRARVETRLAELLASARARHVLVASEDRGREIAGARFANLPDGVDLTPKRLTIDFHGNEDFLQKVGAVVFALRNDYEKVRDFVDAGM
jgi:hypothetical protein